MNLVTGRMLIWTGQSYSGTSTFSRQPCYRLSGPRPRFLRTLTNSMKSWKTPTPEQVERATARSGHGKYNRYFFDHLETPEWIRPLAEKGFFDSPPPPIREQSNNTISFPLWPASRYLARMAKLAPE